MPVYVSNWLTGSLLGNESLCQTIEIGLYEVKLMVLLFQTLHQWRGRILLGVTPPPFLWLFAFIFFFRVGPYIIGSHSTYDSFYTSIPLFLRSSWHARIFWTRSVHQKKF